MSQITLPASFDNISLRKDGSCLLKFETRELTSEELMTVLGFRNTTGWLLYSQNPDMTAPDNPAQLDTKSPSERLRDVLYVFYKQQNPVVSFETFYSEKMESIINQIKNKLTK